MEVDRGELIGLLPEEAVLQTAAHSLRLPRLDRRNIVESALADFSAENEATPKTPCQVRP